MIVITLRLDSPLLLDIYTNGAKAMDTKSNQPPLKKQLSQELEQSRYRMC